MASTVFWTSGRTGSPGSPPTGLGEEPEQDELDELRVGKARLVALFELADLSRFGFGLGVVEFLLPRVLSSYPTRSEVSVLFILN